jgi:UDP-4-amino-4,6-dideoxy-N-acetyl-beta-L-altrosamine transaminase
MISYGKQSVDQDDIEAVIEVLRGDWLTQGPYVDTFEKELKGYFGSEHCAVVSNGTAALHLAGMALEWTTDDIIITTPITFLASANCAIYSGAMPDFVDIDPTSYNINPERLVQKIQILQKQGKRVKAVVAVDYAGNPCDWTALRAIADKYEFKLINDNCHAMGAEYQCDKKYAIKYADIVIQSFHPVKHITSGEGGAVYTNDKEIDKKVRLLRSHGMSKEGITSASDNGHWFYEMHQLGFNYRLTDMQSALGTSQLKRLDSFVGKRRRIAQLYDKYFGENDLFTIPMAQNGSFHAYHLYPIQIDFHRAAINKAEFFNKMRELGILLQVHYIPVHLQPYYKNKLGSNEGDYVVAEEFYTREVSLPIYPELLERDQMYVIEALNRLLGLNG